MPPLMFLCEIKIFLCSMLQRNVAYFKTIGYTIGVPIALPLYVIYGQGKDFLSMYNIAFINFGF